MIFYPLLSFFSKSIMVWQDIFEIFFFSMVIYLGVRWLSFDHEKNLVGYFYALCALLIISQVTSCITIYSFIWAFLPVICMLFMLFHQQLLQRNFVSFAKIIPSTKQSDQWIHEIIRTSRVAIDKKLDITFIIERNKSLKGLLSCNVSLNAPIQKDLLTLLLSTELKKESYFLCDHFGQINGIQTNSETQVAELNSCIRNTDAFFLFTINQELSISIENKQFTKISSQHALQLLEQYCKRFNNNKGGYKYEKNKQHSFFQPHP